MNSNVTFSVPRTRAEPTYGASKQLTLTLCVTGLVALTIGVALGPLQSLNYANVNLYPPLQPILRSYYQGLTIHGVFNALAFTTFFMCGLMFYLTRRELNVMPNLNVGWLAYWIMLIGLVFTTGAIFTNSATVLYTFYAPLLANWAFYLGLALIVFGSWVYALQILSMVQEWKQEHADEITPLVAWMSLMTMGLWVLASLGIMISIAFFLLPLSLDWIAGVDPLVTRTLFWWTGHPLVYFWLMPAYISWYALVPRQAGGKLVSDPLARGAFLLLLLFSMPVGIHHQFQDAGIDAAVKFVVVILTYLVVVPSLMTAFTVGASLEHAGRARGGKGWFGWLRALPWRSPSFSAQALAMLTFIVGGASGMVNASWVMNTTVHNTTFIPGHFHPTVATAVTLTFFGVSYWLLPHLTGKPLFARRLARAGNWLWFIGMLFFANGLMVAGLSGVPRRTWVAGMLPGWFEELYGAAKVPLVMQAVGGVILAGAALCIFISLYGTLLRPEPAKPLKIEIPFAEALRDKNSRPLTKWFDRYWLWFGIAAALVLLLYVPVVVNLLLHAVPVPGLRRW
jgi:cytochrome c oxidase subunit 1